MDTSTSKTRVAVLASPGMGHLIPILELTKRLLTIHNVHVSLFLVSTDTSTAQTQLLHSSTCPSSGLQIVDLSPVNIPDLVSPTRNVETNIFNIMRESLPALRSEIARMAPPPAALIVDLFGFEAFDIADQLALPKYMLVTSTALFLALTAFVPTLDREIEGEYLDLKESIRVPGCKPIRVDDLVDPMMDRKNERYNVYLNMGLSLPKVNGLLLNTWNCLEPNTLCALTEDTILRQIIGTPIYPIGPLVRTVGEEISKSTTECLNWLDKQPTESVLYVSFGSGGTLSVEQITELAWGLELSQKRFIWVTRPPTKKDASGAFFSTSGSGSDDPSSDYLPDGFLTRTRGVGLVVPQWAPQVNILSHPSTGGFLSHCGWNSTLESIINGVPMIAWPLYAEQRMNASILSEDLGVAVQPEVLPTKRIVGREEIERMVRLVMEDEGMKARLEEVKHGALKALDKGGSSNNALFHVVKEWVGDTNLQCKTSM